MRLFVLALSILSILTALAIAPTARAADDFTPAQTKALEHIVHDYIVHHPEVLMEAIQAAEDKDKADRQAGTDQAIKDRRAELYNDPDAIVGGNPHGDVTLVEFFDYRCPYCKQVQPSIEAMLQNDPHLRIVYKEFPILGPASVYATKMALASRVQGKYMPFHQAMMNTKGKIDDATIDRVAGSVGIDVKRAKSDMDRPEIQATISKGMALADALNVNGTPAFVIDGKLIPGAVSVEDMKALIEEARRNHAG